MYQSKIFLHTSTYESQGYVFLEALYCGLTVVCFDVGLVEQSNKMIVCANKEEMLEKLEILLKGKPDDKPTLMKSINETVTEFQKLY
jgi:glycosyltransferase involved in cell wall biosynthesis